MHTYYIHNSIPTFILRINNFGIIVLLTLKRKKKTITPQNKSFVKREKNPHVKNVKTRKSITTVKITKQNSVKENSIFLPYKIKNQFIKFN